MLQDKIMHYTLCFLDIIVLANPCGCKVKKVSINFDIDSILCYTFLIPKEDGVVVMIEKKDIRELRDIIKESVGKKALLYGNEGRNRPFKIEGTIIDAKDDFFAIKPDGLCRRTQQYKDILSNDLVELAIYNNDDFTSVVDIMKQK